jgi:hypothetical protein
VSAAATRARPRGATSQGWTWWGLFVIETVPLGLLGLLLAWLTDGLGAVFNATYLGLAIVGSFRVRRSDLLAAFIVPPIAYAAALVIASPALGLGGSILLGLGATVSSGLAVAAPWIFAATVAAFAVAVWRGRTGR